METFFRAGLPGIAPTKKWQGRHFASLTRPGNSGTHDLAHDDIVIAACIHKFTTRHSTYAAEAFMMEQPVSGAGSN